jgi:Pyridoxamine 5'-phosphate oxidase
MPRRVRPDFPEEWHVPNNRRNWITWAHASKKLSGEAVYWVSTSSLKGKPHAAPVWGIWKANAFYFETGRGSVKGRNLREDPAIVVHLQDGLDTVILEGEAQEEGDPKTLDLLKADFIRKYDYRPDWTEGSTQVVYRVSPTIAHAWKGPRLHRTMVNFLF